VPASERARELALAAAQAAADKKAHDIVIIDVADQLVITDAFLLAAAPNERQVQAIVDAIQEKLLDLPEKAKPVRREGERAGRWVLLDYIDLVVHVQHSEEREFYSLDRLWKDCPTIPFEDSALANRDQASLGLDEHGNGAGGLSGDDLADNDLGERDLAGSARSSRAATAGDAA
jgi:ribosome-associated protein